MFNWVLGTDSADDDSDNVICSKAIKLTIQGKEHIVDANEVGPETTLNEYLRYKLFLYGTKRMCLEGGCGACVVAVTKPGDNRVMAVNSCLVVVPTCHGWKIDTIEGIGGPVTKYHPVQQALANFNGTQCGFCSPGMVMNMFALCQDGKPTMKEVENSFGGNICRCTGYRPILTAFKSLCKDASSDLLGSYPDIEDFVFVKRGIIKEDTEYCADNKPVVMNVNKAQWSKVFTLKDLLSILSKAGNDPYRLVAGNTAKGVYKLPPANIYIDIIDVKELAKYNLKGDTLNLGGNMSLTNIINVFNQIAQTNSKFAHLKAMADHIDLIANVPVRNVGTLSGNLMIKHMHHEFPSDIFLLMETFAAKLIIVDTSGTETIKSLPEFLKYDMRKKVIKTIQLTSLSSDYKYQTYKIMPRAQNAHAMVNCGVLFRLSSQNIVKETRIVFGNINPSFIHPTKTEQYFLEKKLFTNNCLQGAFTILAEELKPNAVLPEPSPEFRKQLAISLLYKAILSIAPIEKLSPRKRSGAFKMVRPISNGLQDYETNKSLYPLTKPIPKLEALAQTSGQAQYIEDIPDLPHQLHGQMVLAKIVPNSKIVKIDASKALALDGIVKFFTKADIPGDNNFFPIQMGLGVIERIFCDETVEYYYQPVGLLVAFNRSVLAQAVDLIEITHTAPKTPPLLNIRDILKANATNRLFKEKEFKHTKIGKDVKHTIVGKFDIRGQYHFHMETQCCLAVPNEDGIDIYSSTQWMDLVQVAIGEMLHIPHNKICVHVRRCGGGFGAKITRSNHVACAAALAAWLLKKPVRVSLSLKENMEMIGNRFPFAADYEVKVNDAGVIQHFTSQIYSDHGVGGNETHVTDLIFNLLLGNYNTDAFDIVFRRAKTDTPANTWTRAPGSAEGMGFIESVMDHIASELKMDPVDVRINNITKRKLIDYLSDLYEWADIDERKHDIAVFNQANRWKKKGISVVPMAWYFTPAGPLTATISIYHVDGSVTISHGGIEIGQGINTKAVQVCAYKFNIPLDKVNVYPSNSMISANCTTTGGSYTSEAICYAVIRACDELLLRLKPYRTEDKPQTWEQLIVSAFAKSVLLTTTAQYDPEAPFVEPYDIYGTCATEVEVDILTGQFQLTRVDLIEDAGISLSPFIDIGQVEGAFIMGLGYYTTEHLVYNEDGKLFTNNTWTYKPPGAKDIPIDFRIKFPKNNPNPVGVLQSKAVGEPPFCLSISIPLAIREAVASARKDSDPSKPKYFFFDGPTSVENTFMNSLNDFKQYTL